MSYPEAEERKGGGKWKKGIYLHLEEKEEQQEEEVMSPFPHCEVYNWSTYKEIPANSKIDVCLL